MKTCLTCGELCSTDATTCPKCGEASWLIDYELTVPTASTSISFDDVSITVDDINLKQASSIDLTGVRDINGGLGAIVTSTPQPKKAKR